MYAKTTRVVDVTDTQLDWLVAVCEGHGDRWLSRWREGGSQRFFHCEVVYKYTERPDQMWPIIEREGINVFTSYEGSRIEGSFAEKTGWAARRHTCGGPLNPKRFLGRTSLIAAARCYVASKLGETVEIPEDLI